MSLLLLTKEAPSVQGINITPIILIPTSKIPTTLYSSVIGTLPNGVSVLLEVTNVILSFKFIFK